MLTFLFRRCLTVDWVNVQLKLIRLMLFLTFISTEFQSKAVKITKGKNLKEKIALEFTIVQHALAQLSVPTAQKLRIFKDGRRTISALYQANSRC
jgi:hypothetical protein